MNKERWGDIKQMVEDKFDVAEQGTEELSSGPGAVEFLEFTGPLGRVRLEFIARPVVLEEKAFRARRATSDVRIERTYSDDEESHSLRVLRYDDGAGDWVELNAEAAAALTGGA